MATRTKSGKGRRKGPNTYLIETWVTPKSSSETIINAKNENDLRLKILFGPRPKGKVVELDVYLSNDGYSKENAVGSAYIEKDGVMIWFDSRTGDCWFIDPGTGKRTTKMPPRKLKLALTVNPDNPLFKFLTRRYGLL